MRFSTTLLLCYNLRRANKAPIRNIAQANESVTTTEFEQAASATALPEGENFMTTLTQKWTEKARREGLEEGMAAQRQTLLRLLVWRFPLSVSEKTDYSQRLALVHDLAMLTQMIDDLLSAQTLADFEVKLIAYLTATER